MAVVRRLTEGDGAQLLEDPVLQKLTVSVRRDVVAFLADLLDTSRPDRAAGLMAFNIAIDYPPGTVGARLKAILTGIGEGQPWADVDALVADLAGRLNETVLDPAIVALLEAIDAPGTGLLARLDSLENVYGDTVAAATSAATAAAAAGDAAAAQAAALNARNAADVAAGEALESVSNSQTAKLAAETAAAAASTSAGNAATSATSAAGSASTASTQAGLAASSASAASGAAAAAADFATSASSSSTAAGSAATAANSAKLAAETASGAASTSATSAASSATSAAGSASTASTKASDSATSASQALGSANAASTSASNAATSASQANTSASAASSSATTAATRAAEAATYRTEASNASTSAAGSAATASGHATTAANAASTAAGSAAAAVTQASNASASASNAAGSATAAATHYNETVAATGGLAASVASLANAVVGPNGVTAQQVLKVTAVRSDGKKIFGAIGLAATAPNDATGGQSEIIFQSDRLFFLPPGATDAAPVQVFELGLVDGALTLRVPAARIGDLTVGTLKIVDGAIRSMGAAELPSDLNIDADTTVCSVSVDAGGSSAWMDATWTIWNSSSSAKFFEVRLLHNNAVVRTVYAGLNPGSTGTSRLTKFISSTAAGANGFALQVKYFGGTGLIALSGLCNLMVLGSKR